VHQAEDVRVGAAKRIIDGSLRFGRRVRRKRGVSGDERRLAYPEAARRVNRTRPAGGGAG